MRKSFVLLGILIALGAVTILIVALVANLKNDNDHSMHTLGREVKAVDHRSEDQGHVEIHALNREVKVVDHLSGGKGHIDVRVTGTGALIIKELSAKTATINVADTIDVLVIIKKTNAQVSFNTENAVRPNLSVSPSTAVNTQILESFVQAQYPRTYDTKRSTRKIDVPDRCELKGNVHTILHLEFRAGPLVVSGNGVLVIDRVSAATNVRPRIKTESDVLLIVLKNDINIDMSGTEWDGWVVMTPRPLEKEKMLTGHLRGNYPGLFKGLTALKSQHASNKEVKNVDHRSGDERHTDLHRLNREVKVVDHLSVGEGNIDVRVTGTGVLIIKELSAKTAMIDASGTTDVMVIIRKTNAQVRLNAEGAVRSGLSLSPSTVINTQMLESFVQTQYPRTYGEEWPTKKIDAPFSLELKGNVHTILHLEFRAGSLMVSGNGALIIDRLTAAADIKPKIRVEGNVLVIVVESDISIDVSGAENGWTVINPDPFEKERILAGHLQREYLGYYEGLAALK